MTTRLLSKQETLSLARYLERYAEPFVNNLESVVLREFDAVIVIPIYDEPAQGLKQFLDFRKNTNSSKCTLLIWVFNAPESAVNSDSLARTQQVFSRLKLETQATKLASDLYYSNQDRTLQLLLIDRCHEQLIPDKQGVGLARKLGMDAALKLITQQYTLTNTWCHWIYSTDADVSLPEAYANLPPKENTSACIYPFKHIPEPGFERAMTEYEFSLYYYVESLRQSGSPYAFHTIGSLIAVSSIAYAQVRGMPKRAGAEDFYLLNKLAKLGKIESLAEPLIEVSGRPSHRVPFGTGPALMKIQSQHQNEEGFKVYHPRIFILIKYLLSSVSEIEHSGAEDAILLSTLTVKLSDSTERKCVERILMDLGWNKQAVHLKQLKTTEALQQAFHVWFDAFITLRFIHELRDRLYPSIDLRELPLALADRENEEVLRGKEFDYTAWFKALGI